jgi:hypothetical protein
MRYLRAAVVAGLVFCVLGPLFVHLVLPVEVYAEFERVLVEIEGARGQAPAAATDWTHVAMVLAMRMAFGFVAMGLFAWLRRNQARWAAARRAGVVVFAATCVPLLAWFHFGHALAAPATASALCYGMIETMLAVQAGAWAWGSRAD